MAKKKLTKEQQLESDLTKARGDVGSGISLLGKIAQGEAAAPGGLRTLLANENPMFTAPRSAIEAQFSDPNSKLYVENPFMRQSVIEAAMGNQRQGFQAIQDRLSGILGSQRAAAETALTGSRQREASITSDLERTLQQRQQEFENQLALQERAVRSGGRGGTGLTDEDLLLTESVLQQPALFEQLTPTQKGQIIPLLTESGFDFLPEKARNSIAALNQGSAIVSKIEEVSKNLNVAPAGLQQIGGLFGSLAGKAGVANPAAAIGDIKRGLVATLSRAVGERGVLTDRDIQRAQALIPTPFDSAGRAKQKIQLLKSFFDELKQRAISTATAPTEQIQSGSGDSWESPQEDPAGIR